jgi:hypothetical protein
MANYPTRKKLASFLDIYPHDKEFSSAEQRLAHFVQSAANARNSMLENVYPQKPISLNEQKRASTKNQHAKRLATLALRELVRYCTSNGLRRLTLNDAEELYYMAHSFHDDFLHFFGEKVLRALREIDTRALPQLTQFLEWHAKSMDKNKRFPSNTFTFSPLNFSSEDRFRVLLSLYKRSQQKTPKKSRKPKRVPKPRRT